MEEVIEAATSNNVKALAALLTTSPQLVTQPTDDENTTLLHIAAGVSATPIVEQLVQRGADVNHQNQDGMTALHVAAACGNVCTVKQLLKYGADPYLMDMEEKTPLDLALDQGHDECAELLLQVASGPAPSDDLNMSMAEAFVSLYDLTQVTQLTLHQNSPTPTHLTEAQGTDSAANCPRDLGSTRRQLFPESEEDEAYLEDTVILDLSPNVLHNAQLREVSHSATSPHNETVILSPTVDSLCEELANTTLLDRANHSQATQQHEATLNVSVAPPPPPIPQDILAMSDVELRDKLVSLGEQPGPVNSGTRSAYQAYLAKVLAGVQPKGNKTYKGYKYELSLVLNGTAPIPNLNALEQQVFRTFRVATPLTPSSPLNHHTPLAVLSPSRTPRKVPGHPRTPRKQTKDHFNYVLLDPLVLDDMGRQATSELERFRVFTESVFYVGKGKNSRSLQHLKDARSCDKLPPAKVSSKLRRILTIWSQGRGVVSLQMFHNTTAEEAFSREACLIEAIGMDMLTNIQKGHLYGEMCGWKMGKRRLMGVHLLYKSFQTYNLNTPQEIFMDDI